MAKRLTDTDIWKTQRWFRKLPPLDKLAFCYIKDQCHHSGIWKIDCSDLIEDLGLESFNLNTFISTINREFDKISGEEIIKERMLVVGKNFLWITGFIQFQYENKEGKVSAEAAPVKTALQYLQGLGILAQGLDKGYVKLTEPLPEGYTRAKDKDIVKDKEKEKEGVQGKEKQKKEPIFNQKPICAEFNGLPEIYVEKMVEQMKIQKQVDLPPEKIIGMWEIFKVQNLTGNKFYQHKEAVFSHFMNWTKDKKFENGNNKTKTGNSGKTIEFDQI